MLSNLLIMKRKLFDIEEVVKQLKEKDVFTINEILEILGSKKYLDIDEMAQILEEPKYTLRFWENEYRLKIKRLNKIRQYVPQDIIDLKNIQFLRRTLGLTTGGVKEKLNSGKSIDDERNLIETLKTIKKELVEMRKNLNYQPTFNESVVIE